MTLNDMQELMMNPENSIPEETGTTTLRWEQGWCVKEQKVGVAGTWWEKGEVTRDEIGKIVRGGTSTLISGMTWHVHSKLNLSTSHPNQFLHSYSFLPNQTLKLGALCSYPSEIFSFVCAFLFLPIDILSQYLIPSHLYCNNLWMSSLPLGSPALISILIPILPGTW